MLTYEQQLETRQWKEVRKRIIERDFGICQHCMRSKNLQVHHKWYSDGLLAWEYPDQALITLCDKCHERVHQSFINKGPDVIVMGFLRIRDSIQAIKQLSGG